MVIIGIMGISVSAIFIRFSQAPSAVTAAYRLLWTVLLMSPVVWGKRDLRRELLSIKPKTAALCALSGVFLSVHFMFWFESLRNTSVASAATIVCTEVIWVSIGFCLFMKGRLSGKAVAAIAVAFIGSVLIAFADSAAGEGHLYGDILALAAAVAAAVYTLIGRSVRTGTSTTVYTYLVYSACAVSLVGICLVQGHSLVSSHPSGIIVGLLLAVFSTILGHSIFSWCLRFYSPSFVSASKLCEPVVAAIIAAFLFDELPVPVQIAGAVMIIGAVYYYSRIEKGETQK